jgi:hypothetical protein
MPAQHNTFGPTRRDFLSGLLSTGTLLVAGCGGGSGGAATETTAGTTGPTSPGPAAPGSEPPVVVARNLGPQAAPAEGIDGGIRVTAQISAAQGGQFEIPGGARLSIPAGALAADTEISVLVPTTPVEGQRSYLFSPAGLRFATPARLAMPFAPASELSVMYAFHASALNPVVDVGSEKTTLQPLKLLSRTDTQVLFEVEHFSFLSAAEATDAGVHLVADFPPETLTPGDLMFYLTDSGTGIKGWNPGHVAMLVKDDGGRADNPTARRSPGLLVEAGGAAGGVGFGNHEEVRTAYGHTFIGAFRHPNSLTKPEQERVRAFLFSKLGLRYSSLYAQAPLPDPVLGEEYNCVGLCELALRSVGKSLTSFLANAGVISPYSMLRAARPVTAITVKAGQLLEVPVYGVVVSPGVGGPVGLPGVQHYSRRHASTITARSLPPDASFVAADLPIALDPNDTARGYRLSWYPTAAQIGQVFEMELELVNLRANPANVAAGLQRRDQVRRVIQMTVVPGSRVRFLEHAIANQVVNVGQDGTVVYTWYDPEQSKRRLSRLAPPVATGDFAPETTLDVGVAAELIPHAENPDSLMLAQVQESIAPSRVRHSFLVYNVKSGAAPDSTPVGSITVTVPGVAQNAEAPGGDHFFQAQAFSSNGLVAGTFKRFVRWVEVGPGSYTASTMLDVWWIPKDGAPTRVDLNQALRAAIVAAKPLPGVERADALFGLQVLDVNKTGVALVAASLAAQQNGVTGLDVVAAAVVLATGQIILLAHLSEMGVGVSGPDAIKAGRINDGGEVVLTRLQSLRTGGLLTQHHGGQPGGRPAQGSLKSKADFQLNSFNNKGVVGGLRLMAGVAKAAVWTPATDEMVDVHAQLIALEPSLRSAKQSSVAQVGENGTLAGRVITQEADAAEVVRDFVMSPA